MTEGDRNVVWRPLEEIVVVCGVLLCAGCGSASRRSETSARTVVMEPVKVTAHRTDDGELELDAYDARDLLRQGNASLASGDCGRAIASYDRLIREFPTSDLVAAAHYNAALCLERQEDDGRAAARYLQLVHDAPESEDVPDALFQAARCYERLEQWGRVVEVLDLVLARADLTPDEHLEAMARRGAALIDDGQLDEGEAQLRRAIARTRREAPEALRTDYYLAQAQHYLGEAPRRRMAGVTMTSVESQFRQALEQRCELLLRAQTQYVQAIRVGNAHWGAASAYRIGEMYSTLFDDVMTIPVGDVDVPPELTHPEEVQAFLDEFPRHYRRLLRQRLEPLLSNAIRWWETNLMMVERTGLTGEWVERTRASLERVRELLESAEEPHPTGEGTTERSDPPSRGQNPEPNGNSSDQ